MSGGPLCVQFTNDTYYPAGIYLGGSAETIVRAIDGAVADLINRADLTANTGENSTGGGVVQLTSGAGTLFAPGYFQITLSPTQAVAGGAGWRILELTNTTYLNDNSATYSIVPATFTLTFSPAFGFLTPANRSLQIVANQTAIIIANYTNVVAIAATPVLSNGALNLTFSAASGQRYALERSTNLVNWSSLVTNQALSNGFLNFSDSNLTNQRGFYRARLVP